MSNDDQRMRELADRLVAMSPEPPPYPEEVAMTIPKRTSKLNPALVFAGAAAVVLVAAAVPFLLSRGGDPAPVGTTAPPVETTVPLETTVPETTLPETTVTTEPEVVEGLWQQVIYLVQEPANSFNGNPALVPFMTELPGEIDDDTADIAQRSLSLLTNPDLRVPDGFSNVVPAGVEVLSVIDQGDDYLIVDMNETFLQGAGGFLADVTMLNQMVYTATQFGRAEAVLFTVNGDLIEAYGTDGLVLTEPVGRDDFLDEMNSIVITSPLIYDGDEVPSVAGVANVYEATVSLQIVETESGEVAYEAFTTATCGTGCWGEFSFDLDVPELTAQRTVLVFWHSPEDGDPSDVVRIPVNPEPSWDFLTP